MILNRQNLPEITNTEVLKPVDSVFDLPEKIIQFGTGVLLRGLPDFYIDKANREGVFNGRIVIVKSTDQGDTVAFEQQDNLYTTCVRGIENKETVNQQIVNASISRVLTATKDWDQIIEAAINPAIKIIISNTTEAGITSSSEDISVGVPSSFPGKLLAILFARFQECKGDPDAGFIILPTELISNNADQLKEYVLQLAAINHMNQLFIRWIKTANSFCNTLVDRIVPGKLASEDYKETTSKLGYDDELMIMVEPFSLWAIESSDPQVIEKLSFAQVNKGVAIVPDIQKFKELKLRLLNGTHTLSCAIALLMGFDTVKKAMENDDFLGYVSDLMETEIGPSILDETITNEDVQVFSKSVIDRFRNPFLDHQWKAISLNYTSKIKLRILGLLNKWYQLHQYAPEHIALGFAAYVILMDTKEINGAFQTQHIASNFNIQDEYASALYQQWAKGSHQISDILKSTAVWEQDLSAFPGFYNAVANYIQQISSIGIEAVLKKQEQLKYEN